MADLTRIYSNNDVSVTNILQLPIDGLEPILRYLPVKDVISFSSTCKTANGKVKEIKLDYVDVRGYFDLSEPILFTTISKSCKYLSLDHCYWLTSDTMLRLLSYTKIKHLHLIECQLTSNDIAKISNLTLNSLSISWTSHWVQYLKQNKTSVIRCFKNLTYLRVAYHFLSSCVSTSVNLLAELILKHCKILQHLKIYQCIYADQCPFLDSQHDEIAIMKIATPLPYLKKLNVNLLPCVNVAKSIGNLLNSIFSEKSSKELSNVYLGSISINLLNEIIPIQSLNLLLKSSTFCLGCPRNYLESRESLWKNNNNINVMLNHLNYKQVVMKNLVFNNFVQIAKTFVDNSNNTLEIVNLNGCNATLNMHKGIELIANHCSKLKFLDLTLFVESAVENLTECTLKAIANLRNLEQLSLSPYQIGRNMERILHYNRASISIPDNQIPLKCNLSIITKSCKKLTQIKIIDCQNFSRCFIHEDTLACIAHCEELMELHMVNFHTYGNNPALPQITTACFKLKILYIVKVVNSKNEVNILSMENCLRNAVSLMKLSVIESVPATVTFVDALCDCITLEKINFENIDFENNISNRLAERIHKLKNLWFFRIKNNSRKSTDQNLKNELQILQQSNPGLVYSVGVKSLYEVQNPSPVRMAHLPLQQYSSIAF